MCKENLKVSRSLDQQLKLSGDGVQHLHISGVLAVSLSELSSECCDLQLLGEGFIQGF